MKECKAIFPAFDVRNLKKKPYSGTNPFLWKIFDIL